MCIHIYIYAPCDAKLVESPHSLWNPSLTCVTLIWGLRDDHSYVCMYTYIYLYVYIYLYIYICTAYKCTVYMYIYIYVCIHIYIHIYIYIYI
jgi:hypothetical protein